MFGDAIVVAERTNDGDPARLRSERRELAVARSPSQTTLKIDLQNAVEYQAVAGEALSMYVTGLGDRSVIPPQVSVGGMLAEVLYFGAAPGYPGSTR